MEKNTIYIMGSGGNRGCTEKLYMSLVDFTLVLNNKHYRFGITDGNLSILCINGVEEKTEVKQGYKNLVITQFDSNWNPYDEARMVYLANVKDAKEKGCAECAYCCMQSLYYDDFCTATGESFRDGIPKRGVMCPFKSDTEAV